MKNRINDITYYYNNKLTLSTDCVYVFVINFGLFNSDDFLVILSNNEINRANEMRSHEKRRQFIITRGITKKILATSLERTPSQINLLYNQHGKPFINDKYNLSGKSLKTKAELGLRMVSPTGIEPVTISLKGRCSTY